MDAIEGIVQLIGGILQLVGGIVVIGGGLAVVVYEAFKHLAAKWLDSRFDQRLQALKHDHDKELEQLRFRISALLDRATKLHQREFEVLPDAWSRLNDAFWTTRAFVSPMQSYPDVERMDAPHLAEFLASSRLLETQKVKLREADPRDRNRIYQAEIFWHDLNDAKTKARDAYTYMMKNGIFINQNLSSQFGVLQDLVWNALVEHEVNEQHDVRPRNREKIGKLLEDGEDRMKTLERAIYERLWPSSDSALTSRCSGPPTAAADLER